MKFYIVLFLITTTVS